MTQTHMMWMKLLVSLVLGAIMGLISDGKLARESEDKPENRRYQAVITALLLPLGAVVFFLLYLAVFGLGTAVRMTVNIVVGMLIHLSVYYLILLALMPLLRRFISARACAVLWIMPNLMYSVQRNLLQLSVPKLVISLSGRTALIIASVWLTGAAGVLVWKTVEHIRFRREVLSGARAVTEGRILAIWESELAKVSVKKTPKYGLVISDKVSSPLSIGFSEKKIKVILPEKEYTNEELTMILRHELVHLCRRDSQNKLFLVLCTAMCWFNPIMWAAMKRSAEDMELSCDETVLLDADQKERYEYAELLLNNTGSTKGFTTCLSANANAMLKRLKAITGTKKKRFGGVVVALLMAALFTTFGYVSVVFGDDSAADVLSENGAKEITLREVELDGEKLSGDLPFIVEDEDALKEYLAGMRMMKVPVDYTFLDDEEVCKLYFESDDSKGYIRVEMYEKYAEIRTRSATFDYGCYYLPDGFDLEQLAGAVTVLPYLEVTLDTQDRAEIVGPRYMREITDGGLRVLVGDETDGVLSGIFYPKAKPSRAQVVFSHEPVSECIVTTDPWNYSDSCSFPVEVKDGRASFELLPDENDYKISLSLRGDNGEIYEAEYYFFYNLYD